MIEQDLKLRQAKPPIVNQQCLVYKFECDAVYDALMKTKVLHQLASIFATKILWLQKILQRILVF